MNNKAVKCVNIVILLVVAALVLALAAPIATAAQTSYQTVGQGDVLGGSYSISAKEKAKGLSGFAQVKGTSFTAKGSVTCYFAKAANYSVIGVEIEEATGDVGSNNGMVIRVQDNGMTAPDLIGHLFLAEPPVTCIAQDFGISEVVSGNFKVDNVVVK